MMKKITLCGVLGLTMAIAAPAKATLLDLVLDDAPDIFSDFLDVTYTAGADSLDVLGFSLTYNDGSTVENIADGMFDLDATVDDFGVVTGGTLTIEGMLTGARAALGPNLLTGNITAIGFQDGGGDIFEFLFEVTGGGLAPAYGGIGNVGGVILDANGSDFTGSFLMNFDNLGAGGAGTGLGNSDTGVPEPATLALMLIAGAASLRRRRA